MGQFGARSFTLNLDTGRATLLPPAGAALDPEALDRAVSDAGFELLGLELEVQGLLHPGGGGNPTLEVQDTGQSFALIRGHSDHELEVWERFAPGLDRDGAHLWVRGRIHSHHDGPTALELSDFRFF